jgi:hypothetical protein
MAISADAIAAWLNRPDEAAEQAPTRKKRAARSKRSKPEPEQLSKSVGAVASDATNDAITTNVVDPVTNLPSSLVGDEAFVLAMARYADGLETETAIRKRYNFDDDTWNRLSDNETLVAKILETQRRRIANGSTARERAQVLHATAPLRVGEILNSPTVSPRFIIEASKEIRAIAGVSTEAAANADKFSIVINLGGDDVLRYDKTITPTPPNTIEATAEDDDGQPV